MKFLASRVAVLAACLISSMPAWAGLDEGVVSFNRKDYWGAAKQFLAPELENNGRAVYYLGLMNANGLGIPKNAEFGFQGFEESAKLGDSYGQNALAVVLLNGEGTARDVPAALGWFDKAIAQDNPRALVNMSGLRLAGEVVPRDVGIAVALLQRAVDLEWPEAMVELGDLYEDGTAVPRDPKKARELYRRAGELDDPAGEFKFVMSVIETGSGRRFVRDNEMSWLEHSAAQGYAPAEAWMGQAFSNGVDVQKDFRRAALWYRSAAEHGHMAAQFNLALLLLRNAPDLPKDEEESTYWFKAAALQGDGDAQFEYAKALAHGVGVPVDGVAAAHWYAAAANAGHLRSMLALGDLADRDDRHAEALAWLRRAATQGSEGAQTRLGDKYKTGDGVPRDFDEARRWYTLAAQHGYGDVRGSLAALDRAIAVAEEVRAETEEIRAKVRAERRERRERERAAEQLANDEADRRSAEESRAFLRSVGAAIHEAGGRLVVLHRTYSSMPQGIERDDSDASTSQSSTPTIKAYTSQSRACFHSREHPETDDCGETTDKPSSGGKGSVVSK